MKQGTLLRPRDDATQRRAAPEAAWPEKKNHLTKHGCPGDFADLVLGERAVHLGRALIAARASTRSVLGDDAASGTCTGGPTVIAGAACSFFVLLRFARHKVYSVAIGTMIVVRAGCHSREATEQIPAGERCKATWWDEELENNPTERDAGGCGQRHEVPSQRGIPCSTLLANTYQRAVPHVHREFYLLGRTFTLFPCDNHSRQALTSPPFLFGCPAVNLCRAVFSITPPVFS